MLCGVWKLMPDHAEPREMLRYPPCQFRVSVEQLSEYLSMIDAAKLTENLNFIHRIANTSLIALFLRQYTSERLQKE